MYSPDEYDNSQEAMIKRARAAFEARPDYTSLIAEADARGFRRIELHEQMDIGWFVANAYSWRGGLWVKKDQP